MLKRKQISVVTELNYAFCVETLENMARQINQLLVERRSQKMLKYGRGPGDVFT